MNLKSIRESYSKLLSTFKEAGVQLTEAQKADVDGFVLAIESNMARQREAAIRQTKKLVEARLTKEFMGLFESITANLRENAALASRIQDKVVRISEARRVAEKVDGYLDMYVESVLPAKTVVDYDRMRRLEKIHESLRESLLVGEDAVQAKKAELEESYRVKASKCETEVARAKATLAESLRKEAKARRELDAVKAVQLLEEKTKDLPTFEARQLKKRLAGKSEAEVEKGFGEALKEVEKAAKKAEAEEDRGIKAEVEKILEGDVEEDDMLDNRPHNGHKSVAEDEEGEDGEPFETVEEVKFDEDGDVQLEESEVIDSGLMKMWCGQASLLG